MSPQIRESIASIITSAEDILSQEGIGQLLPELFKMNEEDLAQFTNFFSGFDLSDPIAAFDAFNTAKEKAVDGSAFA